MGNKFKELQELKKEKEKISEKINTIESNDPNIARLQKCLNQIQQIQDIIINCNIVNWEINLEQNCTHGTPYDSPEPTTREISIKIIYYPNEH